jgi:hypothetical protein
MGNNVWSKNMKMKPAVGDIFYVKLQNNLYCYGQCILSVQGGLLGCYIFFDMFSEKVLKQNEVAQDKILLFGFAVTQRFASGEWVVIGNNPVNNSIEIPEYKTILVNNGVMKTFVVKYDGEIIREASATDEKKLRNISSVTPNAFEYAMRAKANLDKWNPMYDKLIYQKGKHN